MKYIVIILINLTILLVMFLYFRHKINKQLSGEEAANAIRDELEKLVRDINRITMRNSTIIETKISDLREAVKDGEKCIVSLGEKTREKQDNDNLYKEMKMASIKQRVHQSRKSVQEDYFVKSETPSEFDTKGNSDFNRKDLQISEMEERVIPKIKQPSKSTVVNVNEEIVKLHRKGLSLGEIAKQVSKPPGEVEMIIELYS